MPFCKSNPNRKNPADWATSNRKGIPSWNSGLYGDIRLKKSDETKKLLRELALKRTSEWYKINGKKISYTINKKISNGEWHTSLAKNIYKEYKNIKLHGSWELKYAQYLDDNNIKWIRNVECFKYVFENKERRYTPDFFLIDSDEYIEIKGYKTDKDFAKWDRFPKNKKLRILEKEDLKFLGVKI